MIGGDAGGGQLGGLLAGRVGRQALDDFDEIVFGIEGLADVAGGALGFVVAEDELVVLVGDG